MLANFAFLPERRRLKRTSWWSFALDFGLGFWSATAKSTKAAFNDTSWFWELVFQSLICNVTWSINSLPIFLYGTKKSIPGEKSSAGFKNIEIDGELSSDGKKIANAFNKFFASAAARFKQALGSVSFFLEKEALIKRLIRLIPNFEFEMVNESLIVKTLQGLKASKASGLDNISPRIVKDRCCSVGCQAADPNCKWINVAGNSAKWVEVCKSTPLYKKGMSTDMDNYRPISGFTSCVQSVGEGCTSSTTQLS